tara:strand:+ start:7682 stop:8422 length:741 start_codon:yes stop_codon:yes gene_type:complete
MNKYVNYFVISESTRNHQGEKKNLKFDIKKFSKFKDKIKYLVADPKNDLIIKNHKYGHSLIEQHQRDYLSNGLTSAKDEDLIIISDSDEIPDLRKINLLKNNKKYFGFSQTAYCYKLNLFNPKENNWIGSRACLKKNLITPHKLRQIKFKKYPFWRIDKKNYQVIDQGGWHFSYLLNPKNISEKIQSFSHSEDNTKDNIDIENIENKLKKLLHPTKNYNLKKVEIDNTFPNYILNNTGTLKDWILK